VSLREIYFRCAFASLREMNFSLRHCTKWIFYFARRTRSTRSRILICVVARDLFSLRRCVVARDPFFVASLRRCARWIFRCAIERNEFFISHGGHGAHGV